jgi:hypothetical protein
MRSPIGHTVLTSANDQYAVHTPGEVVEVIDSTGTKKYQYIQFNNGTANLTLAAGNVVYYLDSTDWDGYEVTSDISDTKANLVAGIAQAAITDAYYGWVQTWGYYSAVDTNGDDDIAGGDIVWGVGDGTVDSTTAGTAPTYRPVGVAVAADVDADNTVATYITLS